MKKIRKKLNRKSSEKAQKPVFRHIPAFSAGKRFFWKIGLRHILGIAILHHLCAKNQKKLMNLSREKLVTDAQTNEHWVLPTPSGTQAFLMAKTRFRQQVERGREREKKKIRTQTPGHDRVYVCVFLRRRR